MSRSINLKVQIRNKHCFVQSSLNVLNFCCIESEIQLLQLQCLVSLQPQTFTTKADGFRFQVGDGCHPIPPFYTRPWKNNDCFSNKLVSSYVQRGKWCCTKNLQTTQNSVPEMEPEIFWFIGIT